MKKFLLITLTFLALGSLVGCATLFGKKLYPLGLSSTPGGADVFVNGFKMGVTPVQLNLKADKSYTIEFRKDGFENVIRVVNTTIGAGWVILDVLGGLVPIIIDAATGNWNKLDQESVNAALIEQK